jgi:hypothetical protein
MLFIYIIILLSIIYLYNLSQYNLHSFNTWHKTDNWFLHPVDGGCCVFGQFMALLTSITLVIITIINIKWLPQLLYILIIGWLLLPLLMNNSWITIWCIPLSILWIFLLIYITNFY